ncbi:MAG: hypothetical protein ABIH21_00385 [Patescibacteria group bacterium]
MKKWVFIFVVLGFMPMHAFGAVLTPVITDPVPSEAGLGQPTVFSVNITSSSDIVRCNFYEEGKFQGLMALANESLKQFNFIHEFTTPGYREVYVKCINKSQKTGQSPTQRVLVSRKADREPPVIKSITPSSARQNQSKLFEVKISDNIAIKQCDFIVDGKKFKMVVSNKDGLAKKMYMFSETGNHDVLVDCYDYQLNKTSLTQEVGVLPELFLMNPGTLIKAWCAGDTQTDDPCKAVYYFGADGKRHPFPNEIAYFSWYKDFNDVQVVSPDILASITLGSGVTYRPGLRPIKFVSSPDVYVVLNKGYLRRIKTESMAKALYGDSWSKLVIEFSDTFFSHYKVLAELSSPSDYDRKAVYQETTSLVGYY